MVPISYDYKNIIVMLDGRYADFNFILSCISSENLY